MSYKNTSKNLVQKTIRKLLICKNEYCSKEMLNFLDNPDQYLEASREQFFKSDPNDTTTVGVVIIGKKKFVVKRYNVKSFWHSFKKIFRQSRALRSWKNSHYLISKQILTPKPVAVLINRIWFWRQKTYFITEYVEGLSGKDFFALPQPDGLQTAINNIVELTKELFAARITHDDYQHRNLVFRDSKPYLVDLDHMRKHKLNSFWFRFNFRKDIEHFVELLEVCKVAQKMLNYEVLSMKYKV